MFGGGALLGTALASFACLVLLSLPAPALGRSAAGPHHSRLRSASAAGAAQHRHAPQRTRTKKKATKRRPASSHARRRTSETPSSKTAGMSSQRAGEIQRALVAAGYLDHASENWDAAAAAAMKRYQNDHDWQTRFVPDARALIALGLGPAQDFQVATSAARNSAADASASKSASSADDAPLPDPALTPSPAVQ